MNSAHVFKRQSFIAKNERVRIPDGSIKHDAINPKGAAENYEHAINPRVTDEDNNKAIKAENCLSETINEENKMQMATAWDDKSEFRNNTQKETGGFSGEPDGQMLSDMYKRELEELSASVAENAYYDALNKKKGELRDCITSVQDMMDELTYRHNEFIEQYTNELKYMAVEIAEKLLFEKIGEDDVILHRLVLQSVNSVKNAEWLRVELSERLVGLVDFMKKELEKPEYNGRAHVFPVAGTDDICRVTTEDGTIVSTIGVQTNNLRKAFLESDQNSSAVKKGV